MIASAIRRGLLSVVLVAAVVVAVSCGSDDGELELSCQTYFNPALTQSTVPGKIIFGGRFPSNETITITYVDGLGVSQTAPVTRNSDNTTLTLSGLPSGSRQFEFVVKCPNGPAGGEEFTYTIDVK